MKTKSLTLITASIFALVLCLSLVSADTIFSSQVGSLSGWTISPADSWTSVESDYIQSSNYDELATLQRTISTSGFQSIVVKYDRQLEGDWETADNFKFSWSVDGITFTALEEVVGSSSDSSPNEDSFISKQFTLTSLADNNANFQLKVECTTNADTESCNLDNIIIEGTAISSTPETTDYCEVSNIGELDMELSFDNKGKFGEEEDEWYALDEIEVTLDVENTGDEDIKDIEFEWFLYDEDGTEVLSDKIDTLDLDEGDDDSLTFTFTIDPKELESGMEDYTFVIVAIGEMDSGDNDGDETCFHIEESASIVFDDGLIVLDDVETSDVISCGGETILSGKLWNIGVDDQDDVYIKISNKELGIEQKIEIGDIDSLDKESFSSTISVPEDATEKTYMLKIEVFDEDDDVYESDTDVLSEYDFVLKVEGGCASAVPASISAVLEDGGKAGQPMIVKATIKNDGTTQATYTINANGYDSWASTATLDQNTLTIDAGASQDVLITFDVNKGIEGAQTFNLQVLADNKIVASQPIEVPISSGMFDLSGVMGDNWYLWAIGAVNVILILIIIVVALRVSKE